MKKALKILWFAIASLALFVAIAWSSLFFTIGLGNIAVGVYGALIIAIIFFIKQTIKTLKSKEVPVEEKPKSLYRKVVNFLIFLLPFFLLSIFFAPKFHEWNDARSKFHEMKGTHWELYRYHNFPCEQKMVTVKETRILIKAYGKLLPESAYRITHYYLNRYEKGFGGDKVSAGTKFKVIGFYLHKTNKYAGAHYFLLESVDDTKTKIWINAMDIDVESCRIETMFGRGRDKRFRPKRGTYEEEKIDIKDTKF